MTPRPLVVGASNCYGNRNTKYCYTGGGGGAVLGTLGLSYVLFILLSCVLFMAFLIWGSTWRGTHVARAQGGDLATFPNQTTVLTTKGFCVRMGCDPRAESRGHTGKTCRKSSARIARGADTPSLDPVLDTFRHNIAF